MKQSICLSWWMLEKKAWLFLLVTVAAVIFLVGANKPVQAGFWTVNTEAQPPSTDGTWSFHSDKVGAVITTLCQKSIQDGTVRRFCAEVLAGRLLVFEVSDGTVVFTDGFGTVKVEGFLFWTHPVEVVQTWILNNILDWLAELADGETLIVEAERNNVAWDRGRFVLWLEDKRGAEKKGQCFVVWSCDTQTGQCGPIIQCFNW
ncbi:MAG TPA: hypothetical protein VJB99_02225 [Patescibacteria group bacterium]|nr:hypothetical protein [Patescibacteria group bacterium]